MMKVPGSVDLPWQRTCVPKMLGDSDQWRMRGVNSPDCSELEDNKEGGRQAASLTDRKQQRNYANVAGKPMCCFKAAHRGS